MARAFSSRNDRIKKRGWLYRHPGRVGDLRHADREGDLHGLYLKVKVLHGVDRILGDIEMLQDAQGDKDVEALTVGGKFVQRDILPILGEGFHPFRAVFGEVLPGHCAAGYRGTGSDLLRKRAAVKGFPAGFCDDLQRVCRSLRPEQLTGKRRPAAGKKGFAEIGEILIQLRSGGPFCRGNGGDNEAVGCVTDGRFEKIGKGEFPESAGKADPSIHSAGNSHRIPAEFGHAVPAGETGMRPGTRRASGAIQAVEFLAVPDDCESVAAYAVAGRFDDGQGNRRRKGRIDRVAAASQHLQPRLGGERLRGSHYIPGKNRHPLRWIGKRPAKRHRLSPCSK